MAGGFVFMRTFSPFNSSTSIFPSADYATFCGLSIEAIKSTAKAVLSIRLFRGTIKIVSRLVVVLKHNLTFVIHPNRLRFLAFVEPYLYEFNNFFCS